MSYLKPPGGIEAGLPDWLYRFIWNSNGNPPPQDLDDWAQLALLVGEDVESGDASNARLLKLDLGRHFGAETAVIFGSERLVLHLAANLPFESQITLGGENEMLQVFPVYRTEEDVPRKAVSCER